MTKETSYHVVVLDDAEALIPWLPQWQHLSDHAPQQLPQLSPAWVMNYLRYMRVQGSSWAIFLVVNEHQQLQAIVPFIIRSSHFGWLTQLTTPWDYHTRSGDYLFAPAAPREVYAALVDEINRRYGHRWIIDQKGIHADSLTVARVADQFGPHQIDLSPEEIGNVIVLRADSFDAYFAALSKNMRQNLNYARRKLEQLPGYELRFMGGQNLDEKVLEQFFVLEGSGWKGKDGTAICLHEALLNFYRALAHTSAQQQNFELHGLFVDNKLIAAHYAVICGQNMVLQKIAYDESYAKLSPGGVLLLAVIKREYESGKRRSIDLVGRDDWKERWNVRQIHYRRLQISAGVLASALVLWPFQIKNRIKNLIKSIKHRG